MQDKFEILKPKIFPRKKIISGVSGRNIKLFPDKGFSISDGKTDSDGKTEPSSEVKNNRIYFAKELGASMDDLKFQRQTHGSEIQMVNINTKNGNMSDGMITNEKGLILNISIADCCAILVYDPVCEAIGAFHSGWRGTKDNIVGKGINAMQSNFQSTPSDLLIYLSPCASGKRYIVEWDVARFFPDARKKINEYHYLFDNQKQIRIQLEEAGINSTNIEASRICTINDTNYHSYRRDREKAGRMSAFIGLVE